MADASTAARQAATFLVMVAFGPALAACGAGRDVTGSIRPSDYRDRHAIVLTDGPRILDVFVQGPSGVVGRERADLSAYLAEHRRFGSGPVMVQVPVGIENTVGTRRALDEIRSAVGGRMLVSRYGPLDPAVASPLRLSFRRLQARVGGECGQWPDDLGTSTPDVDWRNENYWNYGCAMQSNIASQVADPVDLVRGRAESPPDTKKRMGAFDRIRQGTDPSTVYRQDGQNNVRQIIGN